jgi:hypothetical protein
MQSDRQKSAETHCESASQEFQSLRARPFRNPAPTQAQPFRHHSRSVIQLTDAGLEAAILSSCAIGAE